MTTPSEQFKVSSRSVKIAVSLDVEMQIRKTDWQRVYRKVGAVPRENSFYYALENVSWGVFISCVVALIPLYQATQATEPWVKPAFCSTAMAALAVALVARRFGNERAGIIKASCEEILEDMREVYGTIFQDGLLEKPSQPVLNPLRRGQT